MNGLNLVMLGIMLIIAVALMTIFQPGATVTDATTGTATVINNTTSTVVTHGLGNTPDRVLLSPTTDTDGKDFWVSDRGAATFTLRINTTSTSDITFDWRSQEDE